MSFDYQKEVKILTPNFIDSSATIVSTHGGTTANLNDRDLDTVFTLTGIGGNRDTIEASLTITFNLAGVETLFSMNSFMLFRTNIRDMIIDYYNGSSWVNAFITVSGNVDDYIIRYFGAVSASKIRFRMKKTVLPNRWKEIAELIVARHRFNFLSYSKLSEKNEETAITLKLGNGSEHRAVTRFTENRTSRYGAMVVFNYLTRQQYENLRALKNENSPFLIMPESSHIPEEIYQVNWVNSFTANYWKQYKGNGYTVQMEVKEI